MSKSAILHQHSRSPLLRASYPFNSSRTKNLKELSICCYKLRVQKEKEANVPLISKSIGNPVHMRKSKAQIRCTIA